MKKCSSVKRPFAVLLLAAAFLCLAGVSWFSVPASATGEEAGSQAALTAVTLPMNTSYLTDGYFGVIHISSADSTVAQATVDSENRVVVTAVGEGSTTVSFWYRTTASSDWVAASLPVTVSGKSDVSSSLTQSVAGIVFPQSTVSLSVGKQSTITGVTENGNAIATDSLLWVTPSDAVITVEAKTGKITAVGRGTAVLYALDPANRSVAAVTVQVS